MLWNIIDIWTRKVMESYGIVNSYVLLCWLQGGAPKIAKLVNITPISLWFIGDISN